MQKNKVLDNFVSYFVQNLTAYNILLVKPNAVRELTVLDQELTNIEVQWQPPVNDWKLMYKVSYRSEWQTPGVWQVRSLSLYTEGSFTQSAHISSVIVSLCRRLVSGQIM